MLSIAVWCLFALLATLAYIAIGVQITRKCWEVYWNKKYGFWSFLLFPMSTLDKRLGYDEAKDGGAWIASNVLAQQSEDVDAYKKYRRVSILIWPLKFVWFFVVAFVVVVVKVMQGIFRTLLRPSFRILAALFGSMSRGAGSLLDLVDRGPKQLQPTPGAILAQQSAELSKPLTIEDRHRNALVAVQEVLRSAEMLECEAAPDCVRGLLERRRDLLAKELESVETELGHGASFRAPALSA